MGNLGLKNIFLEVETRKKPKSETFEKIFWKVNSAEKTQREGPFEKSRFAKIFSPRQASNRRPPAWEAPAHPNYWRCERTVEKWTIRKKTPLPRNTTWKF